MSQTTPLDRNLLVGAHQALRATIGAVAPAGWDLPGWTP
jgi:hypothetical protein